VTESIPENAPLEHAAGLRRASDEFMQRLDRLYELESRKRELPPDQAEFVRLAREIEDLARGLRGRRAHVALLRHQLPRERLEQRIDVDTRTIHDTGAARQAFLQSFIATHPTIALP